MNRSQRTGPLTKRQSQVMWLVAEGLLNKEIADRLGLSESTTKWHVILSMRKLGVTTRTGAAVKFVLENAATLPASLVESLRLPALAARDEGRASLPSPA